MKKYKRKSELAETIKRNVFFLILTIVFASTMVTMIIVTGKNGEYTRPSGKFATANPEKISFLASLLNQAKQTFARTFADVENDLEEKIKGEKKSDVFANLSAEAWEKEVKRLKWDETYRKVNAKWGSVIRAESRKYGVNPKHVAAIITKESTGNPNLVNWGDGTGTGAWGLMQIIFSTAQDYGVTSTDDLLDPEYNIHIGVQRLAKAKQVMGDDPSTIFAYHFGETGGPKRVKVYGQSPEESNDWQIIQTIIRTGEQS